MVISVVTVSIIVLPGVAIQTLAYRQIGMIRAIMYVYIFFLALVQLVLCRVLSILFILHIRDVILGQQGLTKHAVLICLVLRIVYVFADGIYKFYICLKKT